jgi:hypothetical protein
MLQIKNNKMNSLFLFKKKSAATFLGINKKCQQMPANASKCQQMPASKKYICIGGG